MLRRCVGAAVGRHRRFITQAGFSTGPPCIGIDLGTTNSCIAYLKDGRPEVISFTGSPSVPTVIRFLNNGQRLFGDSAKKAMAVHSRYTVKSAKRLIGRRFDDPETPKEVPMLTNDLVRTESGHCAIRIGDTVHSITELTAMFLNHLSLMCEVQFGARVERAVVSVPARFTADQRQATYDAAAAAGFPAFDLIDEPVAAALAYGLHHQQPDGASTSISPRTILVFDLGGSTTDISILTVIGSDFDVRASVGDCLLGGDDFDSLLFDHWCREFKESHGLDVRANSMAARELQVWCERAKIALSTEEVARVHIPVFMRNPLTSRDASRAILRDGGRQPPSLIPGRFQIARPAYDALCEPLHARCRALLKAALQEAGAQPSEITAVVLVGAMTAMPGVRRLLQEEFPATAIVESPAAPPDQAVAMGAAIRAGMLHGVLPSVTVRHQSSCGWVRPSQRSPEHRPSGLWAWLSPSPPPPSYYAMPPEEVAALRESIALYNRLEDDRVVREEALQEAAAVWLRVTEHITELEDTRQMKPPPELLALRDGLQFWRERVLSEKDHLDALRSATQDCAAYLDRHKT